MEAKISCKNSAEHQWSPSVAVLLSRLHYICLKCVYYFEVWATSLMNRREWTFFLGSTENKIIWPEVSLRSSQSWQWTLDFFEESLSISDLSQYRIGIVRVWATERMMYPSMENWSWLHHSYRSGLRGRICHRIENQLIGVFYQEKKRSQGR